MKRILTGLFVLTLASTSQAFIDPPTDKHEFCGEMLGMAESLMSSRQAEVSIIRSMEIANSSETYGDILREMVKDAYSQPSYNTKDYQKKSVRDFGVKYYLQCLETFDK